MNPPFIYSFDENGPLRSRGGQLDRSFSQPVRIQKLTWSAETAVMGVCSAPEAVVYFHWDGQVTRAFGFMIGKEQWETPLEFHGRVLQAQEIKADSPTSRTRLQIKVDLNGQVTDFDFMHEDAPDPTAKLQLDPRKVLVQGWAREGSEIELTGSDSKYVVDADGSWRRKDPKINGKATKRARIAARKLAA